MKNRVVFIHTQVGERDGVSLEIEKRVEIFRQLNWEVFFIAGIDGLQRRNSYLIKDFENSPKIRKIRQNLFFEKDFPREKIIKLFKDTEKNITRQLQKAFSKIRPHLVFVHNLFSLPINLPASVALIQALDQWRLPTATIHHDFWFERKMFLRPKLVLIKNLLDLLPPVRDYIIAHRVLNSLTQKELYRRRKIEAQVFGDSFDFHQTSFSIDCFNQDLRQYFNVRPEDLIILQATRIIPRKGVENTVLFASALQKKMKDTGRIIILCPNAVEKDNLDYFQKLKFYAKSMRVNIIWAADNFSLTRKEEHGRKIYGFWDSYLHADIVAYPTIWEGFGNQFLEAVFFKKLIILFEYPVFIHDLKKEGYSYISLGNKLIRKNGFNFVEDGTLKKAIEKTMILLKDRKRIKKMVDKNFQIAKRYHDVSLLKKDIKKIIATAGFSRR